uniref:Uncharacterized protein n=1 Tax=Sphaerodactylus townsendi TaxID=933632 RepID=A0ACB8FHQ7_9SAUR
MGPSDDCLHQREAKFQESQGWLPEVATAQTSSASSRDHRRPPGTAVEGFAGLLMRRMVSDKYDVLIKRTSQKNSHKKYELWKDTYGTIFKGLSSDGKSPESDKDMSHACYLL